MSSGRLANKVAVVTASTEGIGYGIAKKLGKEGAKVVISSRKQENVDKAITSLKSENIEVMGTVCNVSKPEHRQEMIEKAVDTFGGIDILVSNAAANPVYGPILDTSPEAWDKIFDTNVKSSFFLSKEVIPHIESRGGGSIVFVTSIVGYVPMEMLGPYSVSKTALLGLIKAMVPQCSQKNIRVNGLAPGIIDTNFSTALTSNPKAEKYILSQIPMKRLGTPDDTAGVVAFLVSDDAQYVTGETILATGGMTTRI